MEFYGLKFEWTVATIFLMETHFISLADLDLDLPNFTANLFLLDLGEWKRITLYELFLGIVRNLDFFSIGVRFKLIFSS